MNLSHFLILFLVLYGDLIKRIFPSNALFINYGFAFLLLLIGIKEIKNNGIITNNYDSNKIIIFSKLLITIYTLQLLTSVGPNFKYSLSHAFYMITPLVFIIFLQKYPDDFNFNKFIKYFLILMIPINIIGLIQYVYSPNFLINYNYNETGGIVERNLLYTDNTLNFSTFKRYPSLFASADRYSAMSLMQFILSIILFSKEAKNYKLKDYSWILINVLFSLVALGIAGARSRILIVMVILILYFIYILSNFVKNSLSKKRIKQYNKNIIIILFVGITFLYLMIDHVGTRNIPIVKMFEYTFVRGDVGFRFDEAMDSSILPNNVSLFGYGLGTQSQVLGKPGEFGIRAIWQESGIFWGFLLLVGFLGIIVILFRLLIVAYIKGSWKNVIVSGIVLCLIILALLTGLTGAFELSSGIMLSYLIREITHPFINFSEK